jgi:hypothetical protein
LKQKYHSGTHSEQAPVAQPASVVVVQVPDVGTPALVKPAVVSIILLLVPTLLIKTCLFEFAFGTQQA